MAQRLFGFAGGDAGPWRVVQSSTLAGPPLPEAGRLEVVDGPQVPPGCRWHLRGITSNERYVTREEKGRLVASQQGLGRPEAPCAALIPIRKSEAWWVLTQDERRRIFEEHSAHIAIGMKSLPAVARRLHHCRDLGPDQPFDFLTWFEFAEADREVFDELLRELRASPEWRYVDREIDIRLVRGEP